MSKSLLDSEPLSVINVGVEAFTRSVRDAGGHALHVDWQPPGDGDPDLAWALAQLAGDADDVDCIGTRIDRANALAVERIVAAQPVLVDVAPHARDVWPHLGRTLLHAGAPIAWERMCGPMQGAMIGALHRLVECLAARDPVLPAARELTAIGHSSGWDMLAGLVVGVAGRAALPDGAP